MGIETVLGVIGAVSAVTGTAIAAKQAFSKPKIPELKPPTVQQPLTPPDSTLPNEAKQIIDEEMDKLTPGRRFSLISTSPQGLLTEANSNRKTLLGS